MLITKIFGKELRSMLEYVGWLKTKEGIELIKDYWDGDGLYNDSKVFILNQAHTILSQPMKEELLEMFKGEWEIKLVTPYGSQKEAIYLGRIMIGYLSDFPTLNAFVIHCTSKNIPLELKETFEV